MNGKEVPVGPPVSTIRTVADATTTTTSRSSSRKAKQRNRA